QSRMASRKTGLQVTPRSPSGSALATCRLIAKSCLNNRIRYSALPRASFRLVVTHETLASG
ncbi:MAG: hypothetical protein VB124_05635, partial [Burkholderia sp.]